MQNELLWLNAAEANHHPYWHALPRLPAGNQARQLLRGGHYGGTQSRRSSAPQLYLADNPGRCYHEFDYGRAPIAAARNAQISHNGLPDGRITPTIGKLRHLLDISVHPRKRRRSGGMN